MRRFAALAMSLILSGCWSGPPLFDARDAVPVIADGTYYAREPIAPGGPYPVEKPGDEVMTVRRQVDNSLLVTSGGSDDAERVDLRVLAVPLDPAHADRFVLQIERRYRGEPRHDVSYILLDTRPSPARLVILPCSSAVRSAVEAGGGYVSRDPNSGAQCIFRDRTALLGQLRASLVAETAPGNVLELIRVSNER